MRNKAQITSYNQILLNIIYYETSTYTLFLPDYVLCYIM
jgi:hypothetical protein